MFSCMCCGYILFFSKRSERSLRIYEQRVDFLMKISEEAQRINADSLLGYWKGDDMDDRAFQTWESEQLRKGRQRLPRWMKLGFYNVLHRYRNDNVFAASLANINRDGSGCVLYDTYAVLRLAGVERSSGQRAIGTGPMDRVHKHDRVHVAKLCFITVPERLLHEEFRDPLGGSWLIFWHQKLFTLTRFVQALRQAKFDMVTMLTFSPLSQGLADFQLQGLDDTQRMAMFLDTFDEDFQIAATQHSQSEQNSKRSRKPDAILERIEQEREDENFTPLDEAFVSTFAGYKVRPSRNLRITPKQPEGPPPLFLQCPAEPNLPPDVRDRPASAATRPPQPDFEPRTRGRWRWSARDSDWAWEQNYDPNEFNRYIPQIIGQTTMNFVTGWEEGGLIGPFVLGSDPGDVLHLLIVCPSSDAGCVCYELHFALLCS